MYERVKGAIPLLLALFLVACGGGGGGGGGSPVQTPPVDDVTDPPPTPADTTPPAGYSVSFDAERVDLANQGNLGFTIVNAEVGASYSYSIGSSAGGGTISGSETAAQSTVVMTGIDVSSLEDGTLSLTLTMRDTAGNTGLPVTDSIEKAVGADLVQVSGVLTFDLILQAPRSGALDYNNIQAQPIRGVLVEAVDRDGLVLASTQSDESGGYRLDLPENTEAQVRVKAQISATGPASWDVEVTDNTSNDALYVLAGSFADTGTGDSTRDLHAGSGWGGESYTEARSAAPFSILHYVYDALLLLEQIYPDLRLGRLSIRWSVKNNPAEGRIADGDLGSSFFRRGDGIYLLGKEDVDTEEYDPFVILHELAHFLHSTLSRDDTLGGSHNHRQFLDLRVAFSEALASALAAILLDDSLYRDTGGLRQQGTLAFFDVERNPTTEQGWFVENSLQAVIYDIADDVDDREDAISLGLAPILDVLTNNAFTDSPWFTSIYTFLDQLRADLSATGADLSALEVLVADQLIFGTGGDGNGESNDGGISGLLPVYREVTVSGAPVLMCSTDEYGLYNKLGNRAFAVLVIEQFGDYTVRLERVSGKQTSDPDFVLLFLGDRTVGQIFEEEADNVEVGTAAFAPGQYIIEAYDFFNSDPEAGSSRVGDVCFELSVVPG